MLQHEMLKLEPLKPSSDLYLMIADLVMDAELHGKRDSDEKDEEASLPWMEQREQSSPPLAGETERHSTLSAESFVYCRTNSDTSAFSDDIISCSDSPSPFRCPPIKSPNTRLGMRHHKVVLDDHHHPLDLGLEMMKERFSKLLLGEDMSGSGKGVCTAVAISNAITNLYASVFGQHLKLEPLNPEKKLMWKREMACLLSVCDYIVEFIPSSQNFDNSDVQVMATGPRSDIYINLPALKKLDAMLLEILESFEESEFWYAEQGSMSGNSTRSGSFRRIVQPQRTDDKWWLPVPCVAPHGLSDKSKRHLGKKRDCASQIHKAAMAINNAVLSEMEIPDTYWASLPKSGRASVGDAIYRFMASNDKFCPERILDGLNINSEHEALDLADRVEAAMYTWRRKACITNSKSSWILVKELMSETDRDDKNYLLADRAESLLLCLKIRYPELSQTTLDTSKIQYNRDVGQAILESYSRVLEGLAFNIVAWVDDVIFVDTTMKGRDQHKL